MIELVPNTLARCGDTRLLIVIAAIHVALACASSLTQRPWSDEGQLASASYNLATRGFLGTSMMPEANSPGLQGISRHTYWIMPLTMVSQAGWYKIFGFSLFSMRSLSTMYGLIAILACYWLVRTLTRNRPAAVISALIVATDYFVVSQASMGRPDMMCAALGLAAWAGYVVLREKRLSLALLLSHTLVTASGLSHPNGVLYFAGLVVLMIWLDRHRLGLRNLALSALPYLAGGACYGLYILQSPADFAAQMAGNARNQGRLAGFTAPLQALLREITQRYANGFGLGGRHEPGHYGPIFLKSLILLEYVAGLVAALVMSSLRRLPGVRLLLVLFGVVSVILAILDGLKYPIYLVHTLPLLAMLLAVALSWTWSQGRAGQWLAALALVALVALQSGGTLLRSVQNTYQNRYAPAARFLKSSCADVPLIIGSIQFYFDLRDEEKLLDDPYLGYYTHRQPGCIVVDDLYEITFAGIAKESPPGLLHIRETLKRYNLIYDHAGFRIYRRS